jgi:hypothetical protein
VGFNPVAADGSIDFQPRSEIAFLLLDGLKRQRPGGGSDVALCALGLTRDGYPRPMMMRLVPAEDERAWRTLIADLRAEGVGPDLQLIISDGHPALSKAIQATYPDTPHQICVAHRLLSLARKVDARWRGECLAGARRIFAAPDRVIAVGLFREWQLRWLKHGELAVRSLEGDLASCLTFHRFPPHLWSRIRTVNLVERAFRDARRSARAFWPAAPGGDEAPGPEVELGDEPVPQEESGGEQEEKTVLIVPAATNGHVTPELIGDLTMLPEPEQAASPPIEEAPEEAAEETVETTEETVEAAAVNAPVPPDLAEPEPGEEKPEEAPPAEASTPLDAPEILAAPAEAPISEIPPAAHVESAWVTVSEPQEETAVWRPVDLSSDEEFDRRLAAHHRYVQQIRIAVTLTSAAGLMLGVVLAFIR